MMIVRQGARMAPIACMLLAMAAHAGDNHPQQNPTYFGWPGVGPSGPVYKYQHPWTYSFFGHRYYKTAAGEQAKAEREYRIAMGQHVAAMNRIHARQEHAYLYGDPRTSVVPLAYCNANYGQGFGQAANDHIWWHAMNGGGMGCKGGKCGGCGGCDGCGQGCKHCQKHFGQSCPGCGKAGFGHFGCPHCGMKGGNVTGMNNFAPPYYSAYPGMNREDALRYVEGFQNYPPYQLNRSPRDFFMFDTKYNLGQ